MKYFHGTPSESKGKKILAEGLLPDLSTTEGIAKPVEGMVYLSNRLDYAIIYLLGAHMLGSDLPKSLLGEKFGYLFVVDGNALQEIQPDEDQVGEAVSEGKIPVLKKYYEFLKEQDSIDDDEGLFRNLYDQVKQGEYTAWIKAGHLLLPQLTAEEKLLIIEKYGNVAHQGKVTPLEAWRFDKTLCSKLLPDGSNFFNLAERVL